MLRPIGLALRATFSLREKDSPSSFRRLGQLWSTESSLRQKDEPFSVAAGHIAELARSGDAAIRTHQHVRCSDFDLRSQRNVDCHFSNTWERHEVQFVSVLPPGDPSEPAVLCNTHGV